MRETKRENRLIHKQPEQLTPSGPATSFRRNGPRRRRVAASRPDKRTPRERAANKAVPEGATAPETLREPDRGGMTTLDRAAPVGAAAEGVNLSGARDSGGRTCEACAASTWDTQWPKPNL
jgi:hypothetical protein